MTESELSAKGYATTSQVNAKQDKINDLADIRTGAAKGATAIQSVKTINGQSIVGSGNVVISVDASNLVTKEEFEDLTNEILDNEEVHAGAYNDLNTRLNELSENVHGETVTKEEFNAAIEGVNNGISAKQDVLVTGTNIKSINGESILGSGNIKIDVDTSTLATKEDLHNLQNEVIANEEITAAAFNDLNTRLAALEAALQTFKSKEI